MRFGTIIVNFLLSIFLSGCVATSAMNTTKYNGPPENVGTVAVASFVRDEIRGVRSNGWTNTVFPLTQVNWEANSKNSEFIMTELNKNSIKSIKANYDESLFKTMEHESDDDVVKEISAKIGSSIDKDHVDKFLILTQNWIDVLGRQHSALRNFGLMGPFGVLMGEIAKNKGAYAPAFMLSVNVGMHEKMIGKSRCLVGLDMYIVDAKTNDILGKRTSIVGLQEISSDIWGENITDYSHLDDGSIKETCVNAVNKGSQKALEDIGLIFVTENQSYSAN